MLRFRLAIADLFVFYDDFILQNLLLNTVKAGIRALNVGI